MKTKLLVYPWPQVWLAVQIVDGLPEAAHAEDGGSELIHLRGRELQGIHIAVGADQGLKARWCLELPRQVGDEGLVPDVGPERVVSPPARRQTTLPSKWPDHCNRGLG